MIECVECGEQFSKSLDTCPECETLVTPELPKFVTIAAVTAEFLTQTGSSSLSSKIGELWPKNDGICYRLIVEVENKFKRRNKYHSYYDEDTSATSIPARLDSYINGALKFKGLVKLLMKALVDAAKDAGAYKVAGGNIVFMHYKGHDEGEIGRLMAIMVDKKDGFNFDENLVPTDSEHINLEAMRQAALFDLTLFDATYPEVPLNETYLKFIKGASKGLFFREAFGCIIRAENAHSIRQLFAALDSFQLKNELPDLFYDDAINALDTILSRAAKDKKSVPASMLYEAIESALDSDSPLRGTFQNFVNSNGFEINNHIEPTSSSVEAEKWVNIEAADESFIAKVYKQSIGKCGSGDNVQYDPDNHKLILKIADSQTRDALLKLMKDDE
ncbi:nucleoid-associated protein [Shewanella baltica]|uniref:nucleoid-associated protein n=1 Tax=Shewanella baltica TaxID=62322 RepID=UPI0028718DDE|nr:nucleoid-associated protein [Shewanella baltica]MDR9767198.1 nucleoid-associated protein [Shewanella baltica]